MKREPDIPAPSVVASEALDGTWALPSPQNGSVGELQEQWRRQSNAVALSVLLHTLIVGAMYVLNLAVPPPAPPPIIVDVALVKGTPIALPEDFLGDAAPLPPGEMATPPSPEDIAGDAPPVPIPEDMVPVPVPVPEPVPVPTPPEPTPPTPPTPPAPTPPTPPVPPAPEPEVRPQPLPDDGAGPAIKPAPPKPPPPKPTPKPPPKVKPTPKPTPKPPTPKPAPREPAVERIPPVDKPPAPSAAELEQQRMDRIRLGIRPVPGKLAGIVGKAGISLPTRGSSSGSGSDATSIAARLGSSVRNSVVVSFAPGGAGGSGGAADGERSARYFDALEPYLRSQWRQPSRVGLPPGKPRVGIALTVLANGTVQEAHVTTPCGVAVMDASIEAMLRELRTVPAPSAYGITRPVLSVNAFFGVD